MSDRIGSGSTVQIRGVLRDTGWRHEVWAFGNRLLDGEVSLICGLLEAVSPSKRFLVSFYPYGPRELNQLRSDGLEIVASDRFRRRWLFFSQEATRHIGRCSASALPRVLRTIWAQGVNDTFFVVPTDDESVIGVLRERWIDDNEANLSNEELITGQVPAVFSRGWDGLCLFIASRLIDLDRLTSITRDVVKKIGLPVTVVAQADADAS